jgi:uncharacterized DUF497 family protein
MKFDWDNRKAEANLKAHDVSFAEAQEVFFDPNAVEFYDADHSTRTEKRYNLVGLSARRLLLVVYTELEGPTVRIISARKAADKQRKLYEEGK